MKKVYLNLLGRSIKLKVSSYKHLDLTSGYNTVDENIAKRYPSSLEETDLSSDGSEEVKVKEDRPNPHVTDNTPEDVAAEKAKKAATEKAKNDAAKKAMEEKAAKDLSEAIDKALAEKEKDVVIDDKKDESDEAEKSLTEVIERFIDKSELEEFGRTLGVELDKRKSLKNMKASLQDKLEI